MKISTKQWQQYVALMSSLKGAARKKMQSYIDRHGISDMNAVIDYAYGLATKYGEGASAAAAEMYDAIAKSQGADVPPAEVAGTASYEDTAKSVTYAKGIGQDFIPNAVEVLVKQAGEDTTMRNAVRDGAEFAWVPSGDSCAFCLTLASNGWRKASRKTMSGDHADHIHAHCDCMFAIRFDGMSSVEGYDPDKLREQYDSAEGRTWKDKVNSMRREQYKVNGDKIRAQKRANYNLPRNKMLRLAKDGDIFVNRSDELHERAKKIKPLPGYRDYVCHADQYSFVFVDKNGNESNISAKEFCDILDASGKYHGEKIRLLACQAGAGDASIPRYIAKRYNTEVMAPTEVVNVDFDGNFILADNEDDAKMGIETGRWRRFNKDGEIK